MAERETDLRQAIIETSLELGQELGEDGLTMRGIASRLGVSATALYQHFESKSSILEEIRYYGYQRLEEALAPAFEETSSAGCVRAVAIRYNDFARQNPWLYKVLFEHEYLDWATMRPEERDRLMQLFLRTRACLVAGKDSGELRADLDVDVALQVMWTANHGLASLMLSGRLGREQPIVALRNVEEFVGKLADGIMRGFIA